METSENIADLATALSRAQARIEGAIKGSDNEELGTKYADLSAIWAACRKALTRNGLSVVQFPGAVSGNFMILTTMLMHSSGQWIRQALSIPLIRLDPQEYGAALTYARRYALAAIVGVCPRDDDDDAALAKRSPARLIPALAGRSMHETIDREELSVLEALAEEVHAELPALCAYLGVASLSALPASQYPAAIRALEQKRDLARRVAA